MAKKMVLVLQGNYAQWRKCCIQLAIKANNGGADCATPSCNPAVRDAPDPLLRFDPGRPCISFTAVEASTTAAPTEEEGFWSFGSVDKAVGLFSGVNSEGTGGLVFLIEGKPVRGIELSRHTTGVLRPWSNTCSSCLAPRYLLQRPHRTPTDSSKTSFTITEDGSALMAGPVLGIWNDGNTGSVNVLAATGVPW